jgi:deazaflavin-dependent oxidoreductase (nitroreductase family)
MRPLYALKRAIYRGDRPNLLAKLLLRIDAAWIRTGRLTPDRADVLEVVGRRSGRAISVPVVVAEVNGERYLVSMLGEDANWVRNVRAAGGEAVLRRGGATPVRLEEIDVARRAPIIRRYLDLAPGARPHVRIDPHAPLADFEAIAPSHPVFHIVAR